MRNGIRRQREARTWTQAQLADRLDVSRQTVNALETGRYDPSLPLAFRIAALFETPIEQLFTPDDAAADGADAAPPHSAKASWPSTRSRSRRPADSLPGSAE